MSSKHSNHMSDADWIQTQVETGMRTDPALDVSTKWASSSLSKKIQHLSRLLNVNRDNQKAAKYLVWFIENYPESPLFQQLPKNAWSWDSRRLLEAAWDSLGPSFLSTESFKNLLTTCPNSDESWVLSKVKPQDKDKFSLELSKFYAHKYESLENEAKQIANLVGQCALSTKLPACGEKFGLLKRTIPICIKNRDFQTAEALIKMLMDTAKHCQMNLWNGYALIYSARTALKQKQPHARILNRLHKKLLSIRKEIRMPLHLGTTRDMVELFRDLQDANFIDDLVKLLEVCSSTSDQKLKRAFRNSINEIGKYGVSNFVLS